MPKPPKKANKQACCQPVPVRKIAADVQRWLSILLAVVIGWFSPANARAHTRAQAGYDAKPPLEKVVLVVGITMDTDEGSQEDPLSLHKYLYCLGNPINGSDPSGHDDLGELITTMSDTVMLATRTASTTIKAYNTASTVLNFIQMSSDFVSMWRSGKLTQAIKEQIRDSRREWKATTARAAIQDLEDNLPRIVEETLLHWPTKLATKYGRMPDAVGIDMPLLVPTGTLPPIPFGKLPDTNIKLDLIFGASGNRWGRVTGVEVQYGETWQQLWRMDFHGDHGKGGADYDYWPGRPPFTYHIRE